MTDPSKFFDPVHYDDEPTLFNGTVSSWIKWYADKFGVSLTVAKQEFEKRCNGATPPAAAASGDALIDVQAEIHRRIAPLLTKRQQGNVMHQIREVLAAPIASALPTKDKEQK